ncbi:hypothetical protein C8F01DRAFT_1248097 [Mycena amicta]|nr:hypothetical protein C8F01DRAFT_1248097 [Mycena amicta]
MSTSAPHRHLSITPPSTETGSLKAPSSWKEEDTPLVLDTLRRLSPGLLDSPGSPQATVTKSAPPAAASEVDLLDWDAFLTDANYELSFSWKTPSRREASPAGDLTIDPRFLHHPLAGSPIVPGSPQSYAEPSSSSRPSRSRPARAPAGTWVVETPATVTGTRNRKRAAPAQAAPPPPPSSTGTGNPRCSRLHCLPRPRPMPKLPQFRSYELAAGHYQPEDGMQRLRVVRKPQGQAAPARVADEEDVAVARGREALTGHSSDVAHRIGSGALDMIFAVSWSLFLQI